MRSLVASIAFVACIIPSFLVLEALVPRTRTAVRWGALALATGMLVANSLLVRQLRLPVPAPDSLARILAAWGLTELGAYWLHRAMHRVPLLWRVHRMHHVDRPLSFHQSWWIHPLDIALFAVVTTAATFVAGAPLTAAAWLLVVRRIWGVMLHANIRWPATWLDHVIVTPALHHRHHREDLPAANFAPSFSILDRVFGSFAR